MSVVDIPPIVQLTAMPPFVAGSKITTSQGKIFIVINIIQTYTETDSGEPYLTYDVVLQELANQPKTLDKKMN